VPSRSPRDPSTARLKTRCALACDGSEVPSTSEGRTGGNEPSQRHERATYPMRERTGGVKRGRASGARALGPRSCHRSQRTGKPSPRAQRQGARRPPAKGSRSPMERTSRYARGEPPKRSSPFSKTEASVTSHWMTGIDNFRTQICPCDPTPNCPRMTARCLQG
jgi:hypothetical protein